ncbi:TPA: pyridoxal 5'-phosphate synthase glutaminase subunit PdxT, partial [Streptococcus pneumoniae]
ALSIKGVGEDFVGVFIRAPYVVNVADDVEVLSTHGDRMVAVKQNQFLAASFHPELTDDHRVTAYFVEMVKEAKMKKVV